MIRFRPASLDRDHASRDEFLHLGELTGNLFVHRRESLDERHGIRLVSDEDEVVETALEVATIGEALLEPGHRILSERSPILVAERKVNQLVLKRSLPVHHLGDDLYREDAENADSAGDTELLEVLDCGFTDMSRNLILHGVDRKGCVVLLHDYTFILLLCPLPHGSLGGTVRTKPLTGK